MDGSNSGQSITYTSAGTPATNAISETASLLAGTWGLGWLIHVDIMITSLSVNHVCSLHAIIVLLFYTLHTFTDCKLFILACIYLFRTPINCSILVKSNLKKLKSSISVVTMTTIVFYFRCEYRVYSFSFKQNIHLFYCFRW